MFNSPLETIMKQEVDAVRRSPPQVIAYNYKVIVHTPTRDIPALLIGGVHVLRDYYTRFGDVLSIQSSFAVGDIVHDILPNHEDLEITLIRIPLLATANYQTASNQSQKVARYTAKLYDARNLLAEGKTLIAANKNEANSNNILSVDFQLISPALNKLRVATFNGTVRDSSGMDTVRAILQSSDPDCKNITTEPGFDTKKKDHILIPPLTRIVDIPKRINQTVGGMYSAGFCYYRQTNGWYLFAPYNVNYYHVAPLTLTIINIAKNKLPEMEVTFRKTASQLIVLGTGDTSHIDFSETNIYNQGNGVRFVDSNSIIEGFGEVVNNKLVVDRTKNVTQMVDPTMQRKVNNAVQSPARITDKYNLEYSELLRRAGSLVQVEWEAAEIDNIYPGMPVRYMYMDGEIAKEIYGRVLGVECKSRQTNRDPKQRIFIDDAIVTLFVSRSAKPNTAPIAL